MKVGDVVYLMWRSGGDPAGRWGTVGRLERIPAGYRFVYTEGARKLEGFRPFPGLDDLGAVYESEELFPLFANRLLAPSRPEYRSYLEWNGLDPDAPPDPLALLGTTGGLRATDRLAVAPCPLPDGEGCSLTKFFLHGIRRLPAPTVGRINRLRPGDRLGLLPDINNPVDPDAVAVRTTDEAENYLIGCVPRYLACDVRKLCLSCGPDAIRLAVERVNPGAPLQFRLLCRLTACRPGASATCTDGSCRNRNAVRVRDGREPVGRANACRLPACRKDAS